MSETYNAVILGIPVEGSVQSNPSHAKAFGAHGSPIQFLLTPKASWIAIMALACMAKNKKSRYMDTQAVTKIEIHLKYDITQMQ